jgi:hypothetical protein
MYISIGNCLDRDDEPVAYLIETKVDYPFAMFYRHVAKLNVQKLLKGMNQSIKICFISYKNINYYVTLVIRTQINSLRS